MRHGETLIESTLSTFTRLGKAPINALLMIEWPRLSTLGDPGAIRSQWDYSSGMHGSVDNNTCRTTATRTVHSCNTVRVGGMGIAEYVHTEEWKDGWIIPAANWAN